MKTLPPATCELPTYPFKADYAKKVNDLQDKLGCYWTDAFFADDALESLAGQMQFRFAEYIEAFVKHGDDSQEATEALAALGELVTYALHQRKARVEAKAFAPLVLALFPALKPAEGGAQ